MPTESPGLTWSSAAATSAPIVRALMMEMGGRGPQVERRLDCAPRARMIQRVSPPFKSLLYAVPCRCHGRPFRPPKKSARRNDGVLSKSGC